MDTLVAFGQAVKGVQTGDVVTVSGFLCSFGGHDATGTKDYFSDATDFGRPIVEGDTFPLNLYYAHGQDAVIGKKSIGTGTITVKKAGLWYDGQVKQADEYTKMIAKLALEGKLGLSSGAAAHLVERKAVKDVAGNWLARWNLGEASLTPCPAEPRNMVIGIDGVKSLLVAEYASPGCFDGVLSDLMRSGIDTLYSRMKWSLGDALRTGGADAAAALVDQFCDLAKRQIAATVGIATPADVYDETKALKARLGGELVTLDDDLLAFGAKG